MELRIPTVNVSLITSKIPTVVATEPKTICSKFVENCDYAARSKDLNAWDVKVKESNIRFSFNTPTVGGRRARDRGRNRKMRKKRNKKRSRSLKKNKNKNKKNKKNKNKNRERVRGQKGPERNSDDICPEGWVMIVEGNAKRQKPQVIQPKTCLSQSFDITAHSDKAQVYLKKGKGEPEFELAVEASKRTNPSFCLWDCKWKANDFFEDATVWRLGGWNDKDHCRGDDSANCVPIQLTSPQIPEDLRCLEDCFSDIPNEAYKRNCRIGKYSEEYADLNSDDPDIDCILFNRKSDPQARAFNFPLSMIDEMSPTRPTEEPAALSKDTLFSNFFPSEPLDSALVFCIMANLDARDPRRLPGDTPGEFYMNETIWGSETCAEFLPILDWKIEVKNPTNPKRSQRVAFSGSQSQRRISHTRSSGPTSTIIER